MAVRDIMTVFKTNRHEVIGSRYERALYEDDEQMLEDFEDTTYLQFETYKDGIELFTVVIADDESDVKIFENPENADDICAWVEEKLK